MTPLEELELHDAVLGAVALDPKAAEVKIEIELYTESNNASRSSATLIFSEVTSFTSSCDIAAIDRNSVAGNINYWSYRPDTETTHIYLADGYINIKAKRVTINFVHRIAK